MRRQGIQLSCMRMELYACLHSIIKDGLKISNLAYNRFNDSIVFSVDSVSS